MKRKETTKLRKRRFLRTDCKRTRPATTGFITQAFIWIVGSRAHLEFAWFWNHGQDMPLASHALIESRLELLLNQVSIHHLQLTAQIPTLPQPVNRGMNSRVAFISVSRCQSSTESFT